MTTHQPQPGTAATAPAPHRDEPRMTAVIVTYRSAKTLSAALASAKRCVDAGLMRVIVVDNNSTDDTREILRREAGFAQVVLRDDNIGFGRGCNVGLALVQTPYVIFFNPDADMEPAAARTLVDFFDAHPACAIAGPAIHRDDGEGCQHAGGLLTPLDVIADAMGLYRSLRKRRAMIPGAAPFRTDWVSGAMLAGRTEVLRSLKGFDPRFFLYWEETDLCKRVQDAGHQVWAVPGAQVHHVGGVSAAQESSDRVRGCIATHYYKSRQYYLRKHFGTLAATFAELSEAALMPAHTLLRNVLRRDRKPVLARLRHPILQQPDVVPAGAGGVL